MAAVLGFQVSTAGGRRTDSWHRSMDPQRLTLSLVAVLERSADLTTEAWQAAFPLVDDQASVEASTVVEASTAAEATGNSK
jgi:hypothetical protein